VVGSGPSLSSRSRLRSETGRWPGGSSASRSEQGVFFVTGNHEYFVDTTAWLRHLPTLGVDVLRNERVPITRGGATFDLAGIDHRTAADSGVPGHGANLEAALDGRDDSVPVVLLAHQPVQVAQAAAAGVDRSCPDTPTAGSCGPSTT
jgi:predicted MPP superfamily phosphohydrolase